MQQTVCPLCGTLLEYSHNPPRFCSNCGRPLQQPTPETTEIYSPQRTSYHPPPAPGAAPPDQIGGYRLLRPLGSGGMGTVFEAEEQVTGRRVAVKLIRPDLAEAADAVERFRREGRLASTVVHPRCVFVLAADEEEGRPYIVMELMPGRTLSDLVAQRGPLPVEEAVRYLLDVIEGLQEAHRLGVVHRDVKPSNCFLDATGRVKVGDFGLAKSLVNPAQLTQSGAFLGTLLFAAPEQIRNDPVGQQADVYSVAATLYYLLTARAPFQSEDAAATLARTMTDPVTPMRSLRPELPGTLDEVVLRGLARDRDRRWRTLEDLRLALLPFVPGRHSLAEVGLRSAAYLVDLLILIPLEIVLLYLLRQLDPSPALPAWLPVGRGLLLSPLVVSVVVGLVYFAVAEAVWGCSPGKALFRLRVRTRGHDRPGLARALVRAGWFFLFRDAISFAFGLLAGPGLSGLLHQQTAQTGVIFYVVLAVWIVPPLGSLLGILVLASTMTRRNGYRGVHELLSGTQTIQLPQRVARPPLHLQRRRRAGDAGSRCLSAAAPLPARLGSFTIQGALRQNGRETVLLGEDSSLGRRVWIWLREPPSAPGDAPPRDEVEDPATHSLLPSGRREVARATRLRWLQAGEHQARHWDAFLGSEGCSLPELVRERRRLYWVEVQSLLEQLAEELDTAASDGTVPARLGVGQVWIQPGGRVQLLDTPLGEGPVEEEEPLPPQKHALRLLARVARLALEGRLPPPGQMSSPVRAPLPGHAAQLVSRLLGSGPPFRDLAELREALDSCHEMPAEVSRGRRGLHLLLLAFLLGPGLAMMLAGVPVLVYGRYIDRLFAGVLGESALLAVEESEPVLLASLAADPDPWGRLPRLALMSATVRDGGTLRRQLERADEERAILLASASWLTVRLLDHLQSAAQTLAERAPARTEDRGSPLAARALVKEVQADLGRAQTTLRPSPSEILLNVGLIAFWPIAWTLWSALTRGGWSRWLAGIKLVDGAGRPASRLRCALRSAIIWTPPLLLLSLSLALDMVRIGRQLTAPTRAVDLGCAWAAWLAWCCALLLFPTYLWLAQRYPARAWYDHLAGTYAVPR